MHIGKHSISFPFRLLHATFNFDLVLAHIHTAAVLYFLGLSLIWSSGLRRRVGLLLDVCEIAFRLPFLPFLSEVIVELTIALSFQRNASPDSPHLTQVQQMAFSLHSS